jgi:hypothetical protein
VSTWVPPPSWCPNLAPKFRVKSKFCAPSFKSYPKPEYCSTFRKEAEFGLRSEVYLFFEFRGCCWGSCCSGVISEGSGLLVYFETSRPERNNSKKSRTSPNMPEKIPELASQFRINSEHIRSFQHQSEPFRTIPRNSTYFKTIQNTEHTTCSELFRLVRVCSEMIGTIRNSSDMFGVVRMCSELFDDVLAVPELFGIVWTCSKLFRNCVALCWTCSDMLGFVVNAEFDFAGLLSTLVPPSLCLQAASTPARSCS